MNKKLFLKLGLLVSLTSLSFIACGQKDNSTRTINSSKNIVEHKPEKAQENTQEKAQENTQEKTKQEVNEKDYYTLIKEAWQNQKNYINSIDDSKVKQSLQTPRSAAISKSTELLSEYTEDSKSIQISLKKVLDGENF